MTKQPQKSVWHWDRYWRFNRVASCYDQAGSNYPEDFQREWASFFSVLPEHATILDLCTGNGAVARIAAKQALAEEKDFHIVAIDQAAIDPKAFVAEHEGEELIDFVPGVPAENLPFEENTFTAAASQYGIEYAEQEDALGELARVLAPGAPAKLIVHAVEGTPDEDSARDIARVDYLADELKIFEHARAAMTAMWAAEKAKTPPTQETKAFARVFLEAINTLDAARKTDPNPIFESTFGVISHTFQVRAHFPLEPLIEKIGEAELEAWAHRERLVELRNAALSKRDCIKLVQIAENCGLASQREPTAFRVGPERELAGWKLAFKRVA